MSPSVQVINDWIRQNQLPVSLPWTGPRASLTFDAVRLHLQLLAGGIVMAEARICDLPAAPTERDRLLSRLAQISLARMRDNRAVLSVDVDGAAAWLQRRIGQSFQLHELDEAVEAMVNEVELWRSAL